MAGRRAPTRWRPGKPSSRPRACRRRLSHRASTLSAGDLALDFQGLLNLLEKGNKIAGDLRLKAADGEQLAAMAGLSPPLSLAGVGIDGGLKLVVEDDAVTLEQLLMTVGGSEVRGRIALAQAAERRQVEARLELSELSDPLPCSPPCSTCGSPPITGAAEPPSPAGKALGPKSPLIWARLRASTAMLSSGSGVWP